MRKTLRETARIDQYLQGTLEPGDHLLFEAQMILDPALPARVSAQSLARRFVRWIARDRARSELNALHRQVMADRHFAASIRQIFK